MHLRIAYRIAESIVRKGGKCCLLVFSHFPTIFSEAAFLGVVNIRDCVLEGNPFPNDRFWTLPN